MYRPRIPESWKEPLRPYYLKWLYFPLAGGPPRHFQAGWQYPPLRESALDPAQPGKPDLLILPMNDWHSRLQRTQHLTLGLCELGQRCFYLSPHLGREFPTVFPASPVTEARRIAGRIAELHVHLPREPVYHHRLLESAEEEQLTSALRKQLAEAGSIRPVVLVSFPGWVGVAKRLKSELGCQVIYDCHDLIEGFDNVPPVFQSAEAELFRISDLVLFTADWLREQKVRSADGPFPAWIMLRNAVTPADFGAVKLGDPAGPVTIGYVGAISPWFDADAIAAAAAAHPEWRFLLVGRPETQQAEGLKRFTNVEFPGEVDYRALPEWLSKMTVGVIPFLRTPLTMATNPVKLYEYLASGMPVVSADLPEVARLGDLVRTYRDPAAFVRQLECAVADNADLQEARRRAVQGETWHARCLDLQAEIARLQSQSE